MELEWFDYYLRGVGAPPALDFSFLRDWVNVQGRRRARGRRRRRSYPAGPDEHACSCRAPTSSCRRGGRQVGQRELRRHPGAPRARAAGSSEVPVRRRARARSRAYDTAPLGRGPPTSSASRRLTVRVDAPTSAPVQGGSPRDKLVLFAKLLDVDPGGNTTLPRNLLSAVRVADVTKPVDDRAAGHRPPLRQGPQDAPGGHHQQLDQPRQQGRRARCRSLTDPVGAGHADAAQVGSKVSTLPGRCLARRSPIGPRNIGRIRLGYTRSRLLSRVRVQPERRTARTFRYCVTGRAGHVMAVFSSRSRRAG